MRPDATPKSKKQDYEDLAQSNIDSHFPPPGQNSHKISSRRTKLANNTFYLCGSNKKSSKIKSKVNNEMKQDQLKKLLQNIE